MGCGRRDGTGGRKAVAERREVPAGIMGLAGVVVVEDGDDDGLEGPAVLPEDVDARAVLPGKTISGVSSQIVYPGWLMRSENRSRTVGDYMMKIS